MNRMNYYGILGSNNSTVVGSIQYVTEVFAYWQYIDKLVTDICCRHSRRWAPKQIQGGERWTVIQWRYNCSIETEPRCIMHVECTNTVQFLIDIMVCVSNICCHDCCQYINVLDLYCIDTNISSVLLFQYHCQNFDIHNKCMYVFKNVKIVCKIWGKLSSEIMGQNAM